MAFVAPVLGFKPKFYNPIQPQLYGQSLGTMSDNSTVVAYLTNGDTKLDALCQIMPQTLYLTVSLSVSLKAHYIPGKKNGLADALSWKNRVISIEWSLRQVIATAIIQTWALRH